MAELQQSTLTGATNSNPVDQISALLGAEIKVPPEKKKVLPKQEALEIENLLLETDEEETDEEETDEETDEGLSNDGRIEDNEKEETDEEITWAKTLKVDDKHIVVDEDGNFSGINVKVDGKVSTVDLPELIAGYQINKHNTNTSKALAESRKELDSIKNNILVEYSQKIKDAEALSLYLENSINKEFSNLDWNTLRFQDPAEYAALVQDYNIRTQEISKIKEAINTVRQTEQQGLDQEFSSQESEYIQSEVNLVIEKNPKWAEPKVFKKVLEDMAGFVEENYGFTRQEFAQVKDSRILELIKDAQKYRSGMKVAELKINRTVPKYQKTAGAQKLQKTKLEVLTQKAKDAKGYQKREAATDAIAELLSSPNR